MSIRDDTIRDLEQLGFSCVGSVNGRTAYQNGPRKVLLPPGLTMTPAQRDACLKKATAAKSKTDAAKERARERERKLEEERIRIEAEIERRNDAVFGALADVLSGAEKRDVRRQMVKDAASIAATLHLITEIPKKDDRAKHRA